MLLLMLSHLLHAQTGIAIPQMTSCDNLVNTFMTTHSIPGLSLAIAKDGKLVYHRAFGTVDQAGTEITLPHHLFRIASVSKPITAIAIMKMVEQNQISLSDKVFGSGGLLENHSSISTANITDARLYDITVQHLLEHAAGWDRNANCFPNPTSPYPYFFSGCDPIVAPLHVTETLGTANPATEEDMITYLLEKGVDHAPNSTYAYSNIGYLVLGEIIEEISGLSYEAYVQTSILDQLGICDMHMANNLLTDKQEREVEYIGNGFTNLSCYNTGNYVPWEYGGFNIEAMDAHGGWIATTRDLVKLVLAVDGFSSTPDILSSASITTMTTPSTHNSNYALGWSVNSADNWWHTGALDGTASIIVRTSGEYTWAMLLNKRQIGANANQFWADLDNLPWSCVLGTSSFPSHDLLEIPLSNSSGIGFTSVEDSSVAISWTNGDGDKRIVVVRENDEIETFPLDGQSYAADPSFALGDDLGSNTFVVYNGSGTSVTVSDLTPGTTYQVRVFEYNESVSTGNYPLYKLCGGDMQSVTTSTLSSTELGELEQVKIYPTLSTHSLHIETPSSLGKSHFQIFSLSGMLCQEGSCDQEKNTIQIADLQAGMYLLRLETSKGQVMTQKFVKY